jgi:hypothetical protein
VLFRRLGEAPFPNDIIEDLQRPDMDRPLRARRPFIALVNLENPPLSVGIRSLADGSGVVKLKSKIVT